MFLLHPPIPPWLDPVAGGWRVSLLLDGEATAGVFLHCTPDNEARLIPMRPAGRCGALRRFDALLPIDHGNPVTLYAFKVLGGDGQRWLAADGQHAHVPAEAECFRANPDDRPPTWVREQVFYEIFPDRFARSGAPRDRRGETVYGSRPRPVVQKAWGEPPDPAQASNTFGSTTCSMSWGLPRCT
jgi:alpha-glucosidase